MLFTILLNQSLSASAPTKQDMAQLGHLASRLNPVRDDAPDLMGERRQEPITENLMGKRRQEPITEKEKSEYDVLNGKVTHYLNDHIADVKGKILEMTGSNLLPKGVSVEVEEINHYPRISILCNEISKEDHNILFETFTQFGINIAFSHPDNNERIFTGSIGLSPESVVKFLSLRGQ